MSCAIQSGIIRIKQVPLNTVLSTVWFDLYCGPLSPVIVTFALVIDVIVQENKAEVQAEKEILEKLGKIEKRLDKLG